MRFACLGSGSRGNATLVEEGATTLLVDCGFSVRETERRLARLGKQAGELAGILVTHEHSDHVAGVAKLARKHALTVWTTRGTWASHADAAVPSVTYVDCHECFAIGDLEIQPFPVPHDAREPAQFVFRNGAVGLGVLTDAGCITPHMTRVLAGCEALLIECNHDEQLLAEGDYPVSLKQRVGGRFGHLSNRQAGELLSSLAHDGMSHVVAAHLSDTNNTPAHARKALSMALGCEQEWIGVAAQDAGLDWREL